MCRLPAAGTVSTHILPHLHTHTHRYTHRYPHPEAAWSHSRLGGRVVCVPKTMPAKPRQAANLDGADNRRQAESGAQAEQIGSLSNVETIFRALYKHRGAGH